MHEQDRLLVYVEIDLTTCSLTYSVPPCEAELGVTGDIKCFNTLNTCQDRDNFTPVTTTLRFSTDADYRPRAIEALPLIDDWEIQPPRVSLGEDMGQRGGMHVLLKDAPHPDTGPGFDPYVTERDYNPYEQGTMWGKFRARQPFVSSNNIRIITGFLPDAEDITAVAQGTAMADDALREQVTRHYMVETFEGPRSDGTYELVGKDLLKLVEGRRGQVPRVSNGRLLNSETNSDTTFVLTPTGIGDDEYATSGYLAIGGKEIVSFTRSSDTLTVTRGQLGTTATEHEAGDRVQTVVAFLSENPSDIIRQILTDYCDVDDDLIPIEDWNLETSAVSESFSGYVAEPTSAETLIAEIIRDAALALWWDAIDRKFRLQALRAIPTASAVVDEMKIVESTLRISEQPEKRLSQSWTWFGKRNPLEGQEDPSNYKSSAAEIDLTKQSDYGSPGIKKIFTRWISTGGRTIAERLNSVILSRFGDPPRSFEFEVWRDQQIRLGGGYMLEFWPLQDATGARASVPIQVTRVEAREATLIVEAEELFFEAPEGLVEHLITFDFDDYNINLRTVHDLIYGSADDIDTGASPQIYVRCVIASGVTIGSTSVSLPAFHVGNWPSGIPLYLENYGRIQGRGGRGGNGGYRLAGVTYGGTDGEDGGTAFYTRENITVANNGEIWGGAAGGGGGGGDNDPARAGGGGGGGAGTDPGIGGSGGVSGGGLTGEDGHTATPDNDGNGGLGSGGSTGFAGGDGGDPGDDGSDGGHTNGGQGGDAGYGIDGNAFITFTESGDIRGDGPI